MTIKPAFGKLSIGTSNSGKPKSPIEYSQHPHYHASTEKRNQLLEMVRQDGGRDKSSFMCWDSPDFLGPNSIMAHPWFMEQPQFKSLFDQALAIKQGKLLKMNKEGKVELAKQIIAASDAVLIRLQTAERPYSAMCNKKKNEIQAQLNKVVQEEKLAAGGGGCCIVL